jgi:hypothetical protein
MAKQAEELSKEQKFDRIKEEYEKVTPLSEQLKLVELEIITHRNNFNEARNRATELKKQIKEASNKIDDILK